MGLAKTPDPYSRVWGLTGIIGSGKSTAAKFFAEQGAFVIDADVLAREVIEPKSKYYSGIRKQLEHHFGKDLFFSDGRLNRKALSQLAFDNAKTTALLNSIFHPAIGRLFAEKVNQAALDQVIIYDVPLLFENNLHTRLKGSIVVYTSEHIALKRASQRGGLPLADIKERLSKQISIQKKAELADYVIVNEKDLTFLAKQVKDLFVLLKNKE